MIWTPKVLLKDFLMVSKLAGIDIQLDDICIQPQKMPHRRPSLPEGKVAVYVFSDAERVLKVGKAGQKSGDRYRYHHYNPCAANSTLAASLVRDECAVRRYNLNKENVGAWIMENTDRVNFILEANVGMWALMLLEAFVQCRLQPAYEGFASQR